MWLLIIGIVVVAVIIAVKTINKKSYEFVEEHSILLQNLKRINSKYIFKEVSLPYITHEYDNRNFYNEISCDDYLIYQLRFKTNEVTMGMEKALYNNNLYDFYMSELNSLNISNRYDYNIPFRNLNKLREIENKIYSENLKNPVINYFITVELKLTDINGKYITSKYRTFYIAQIEEILERLRNKTGERYNDEGIWNSIERVERGRVSNKMRFSIYDRDGYRCVKCGRRSDDLEIDHKIPISKGGKSTYDNLQTLCKRCNMNKSNIIEGYTSKTYNPNIKYCPKCKAPLRVVNGKYGKFYGCSNYPRCEYSEKIK